VVILSENSLEHALLALGLHGRRCALRAHFATLFADQPRTYDKLKHVLRTVTPGLVFAGDARYAKAICRHSGPATSKL